MNTIDGVTSIDDLVRKLDDVTTARARGGCSERANYLLAAVEYLFQKKIIAQYRERQKTIDGLIVEGHGALVRWGGDYARGCRICLDSEGGFLAIRSASTCNLRCKFCYYYGRFDDMAQLLPDHFVIDGRFREVNDIKNMVDKQGGHVDGLTWVYFEPFAEIEKHYELAKYIHDAGIYQWIYTNGTLCTEETLQALAETGLEEIRFDLAASMVAPQVLENVRLARKYFSAVGLESPMFPEYFDRFVEKEAEILDTGIEFINAAELHLGPNNIANFPDEDLYVYKYGYVSPVGSRHLTYDLIERAEAQGWQGVTINDCSNEAKVYRGINRYDRFGALRYESENGLPAGWHQETVRAHSAYFAQFVG